MARRMTLAGLSRQAFLERDNNHSAMTTFGDSIRHQATLALISGNLFDFFLSIARGGEILQSYRNQGEEAGALKTNAFTVQGNKRGPFCRAFPVL